MKKALFSSQTAVSMVILVVCLFIANLVFAHHILNVSIELTKVKEQAVQISNQTNELKVRVSILTSGDRIIKEAKELGFVADREILYLESHKTLAQND